MSSLSTTQKKLLEKLFQMGGGYVLNFSDRTFSEFFRENLGIDIYSSDYMYASGSKANLMRGFWLKADDRLVAQSILKLVEYIENEVLLDNLEAEVFPENLMSKAKEMASGLSNDSTNHEAVESDFLKQEYIEIESKARVITPNISDIISQRLKEIDICIHNNAPLGAIFLAGSTLEGILLDNAMKHPQEYADAKAAPKKEEHTIPIDKWTLSQLIDVSYELNYVDLNTKIFGHGLRDLRNFIHPREQQRNEFDPDMHSAKICHSVLLSTIDCLYKHTIAKRTPPKITNSDGRDVLYDEALELVRKRDRASATLIGRHLKIGYSRSARILDQLEQDGMVSKSQGGKPRMVLIKS